MEKSPFRQKSEAKRKKVDRIFIASALTAALAGGTFIGATIDKNSKAQLAMKEATSNAPLIHPFNINTLDENVAEKVEVNPFDYPSWIKPFNKDIPLEPVDQQKLDSLKFQSDYFISAQPECKITDFGKIGVGEFADAIKDNSELTIQCGHDENTIDLNYSERVFKETTYLNASNNQICDNRPSIAEISGDLYKLQDGQNLLCPLQPYAVNSDKGAIFANKTNNNYVMPVTIAGDSYPIKPVYVNGNTDLITHGDKAFALFERKEGCKEYNDSLDFLGIISDNENLCDIKILK